MPDFIKMDVEGAELFALKSMKSVLSSAKKPMCLIEMYAPWQRAMGIRPWDPIKLLKELGYSFLFMCPEGLIVHDPSEICPTPPEFINGYNVFAYCTTQHKASLRNLNGFISVPGSKCSKRILEMLPPPWPNK
jgi:hypothetical protein